MKKFLLVCMLALGIGASSQIVTSEGFESTTFPPTGWSTGTGTTAFTRVTTAGYPCVGTAAARKDLYFSNPYLQYQSYASNGEAISVSFQYTAKQLSTSYAVAGNMVVEYSMDGGVSWKPLGNPVDFTAPVNTCTPFSGTVPAGEIPVDSDFRLKITGNYASATVGTSDWYLTIDDVQISQTATCYAPTNVTASNIGQNSTDISWTAPATAPSNGYEVYYSTSSTQPLSTTTPSITGVTGTSVSLSSLATSTANTKYYVWVRSACSPSDKSAWSMVGTFKTLCTSTSTALAEDFETYAAGNIVPDCWARIVSGTGTQSISTASPASGTKSIYQSSSSAANSSIVVLPQFGNINAGTHWLKFKVKMSNAGSTGNLDLGYVTDASSASSFVNLQNITITNTGYDANSLRTLIVPNSVPANARLAIRNNGSTSFGYYWDDVIWEPKPTCFFPTGITVTNVTNSSATINWSVPYTAPANGYEYYYSTTNTPPTAGTTASGSSAGTSATISGLATNTVYYVWVRSVCNPTSDKSEWTLSYSFKTNCDSVSSIDESFETYTAGTSVVPACWDRIILGTGSQLITSLAPVATGNNHIFQSSSSAANATIVVLPPLSNINAGTNRLKFKARVASGVGSLDVGYVTDLNASSFVNIQTISISNTIYNSPEAVKIILIPTSVPANARLAIRNNGTSTTSHLWDDVVWEPIPSCPEPTNLMTSGATPNSMFLSWTAASSTPSNGYDIYYNTDGTNPTGASVPQVTNVTGTSTTVPGLASGTLYYFWLRSNCGGQQSVWTGPLTGFTGYCIPTGGLTSTAYYLKTINVVGGGTDLNYSATSYSAYVNNSATSFSTYPGGLLSYSMTQQSAGTAGYFYLWIDYNNDLDFNDPGETVIATTATGQNAANGTFTVPSTVAVGNYRTRFGQSYTPSGAITACGPSPSGGYVDYTLSVIPTPSCIPPTNPVVNSVTSTTANVSWTAPTPNPSDGYEYYYSTTNTAPVAATAASGTSATTSPTISSLTPNTTYYLWVRSVCGGSKSWWSLSSTFKTQCTGVISLTENFDTYGTGSVAPPCWDRIVLGSASLTINNSAPSSGANNMYQYSSNATNYSIAVMPPLSNVNAGTYRLRFKARAGSTTGGSLDIGYITNIADPSSFVTIQAVPVTNAVYTDPSTTITVAIPASVPSNARLAVRNNGVTAPNVSIYWDDMVWELNPSLGTSEEIIKTDVKVYPNPFDNILNISDTKDIKMVTIRDLAGRVVKTISKPSKQLDLLKMTAGIYIISLHYENGTMQTFKTIKK